MSEPNRSRRGEYARADGSLIPRARKTATLYGKCVSCDAIRAATPIRHGDGSRVKIRKHTTPFSNHRNPTWCNQREAEPQ